jgi:hypothetical protein
MLMRKNTNLLLAYIVFLTIHSQLFSQVATPKGLWKFDDNTNLTKAEIGNNLELVGTQTATNGPVDGNGAVKIGTGSYYKIKHGIVPNGGGTLVNEYSIQIDFLIHELGGWHCFFQTSPTNSNDGDCFINPSGNIGVQATGYSTYSVKPNEWYRLVISVKNGTQYEYYLDGQLIVNSLAQDIDGRFALDTNLLLFADDDGEDGEIDCTEIAIWNYALTTNEIKSLGNYGHSPKQLSLVPYLQTPTANSIYISWHDSISTFTKVEYGTTSSLGQSTAGTSEIIYEPYIWHTVKLSGLQPNTEYYYRVISGGGLSKIYSFKTQPSLGYTGKIRFLLLSDTHASDTTMAVKVIKGAKKKMQQLYGNDYQNYVNLVLHSGDLVVDGYNTVQWTDQYFAPMSPISPNIPFMTVPGNHEREDFNYYAYMKYDDVSAYPDPLNEKFWSFNLVNSTFIGLNSNLTNSYLTQQSKWLDKKLEEIESDPNIDFVFLIVHHPPISELWGEGMSDDGSIYVKNQIIPILKKYSKVVQLSYGHTHGFERGTIESEAVNSRGDFRIVCGGGGGGPLDRWGAYTNFNFPSIQISLDNYFYQIIEIDVANKTFESSMYSLGNLSKSRDSELMDKWYRKINQPAPSKPEAYNVEIGNNNITFNTSKISIDSLMTARIQITDDVSFYKSIIDTMIHWENVYDVNSNFNPINWNEGLDLTRLSFSRMRFMNEKTYYYKVRYRDHNLKWSDWSNIISFNVPSDSVNNSIMTRYDLKQNFPNPFNSMTKIIYQIPRSSFVTLKVYDILGSEIVTLVNQEKKAGQYEATFDSRYLSSGVYFYKIQTEEFTQTKKLIIIK